MPERFRVAVAQPVLDDLARRLEFARWPQAYALDGGEDAARLDRIARLLERWRGGYEWCEHEARINEHPQFVTSIDGQRVHFLHVRSPDPDALPLIATHGWPMTTTADRTGHRRRCAPP